MSSDIPLALEVQSDCPPGTPAVAVGFGMHPIKDEEKSTEAGSPIFRDVEFVRIVVPGDRQSEFLQPATDIHRRRFPRAYERFKKSETTVIEGTPIEQWPQITRSEAMTLKANNIFTVEMLAEVHDGNLARLGFNGRQTVAKAKAFLAQARDGAVAQKLAAEKEELQAQLRDQQRQIAELAAKLDAQAKLGPLLGAKKAA